MSPILQSLANGSARGYGAFFGAAAAGAFESIATTTLSTNTGWVEFSSIPSTFQHLQVRIMGRCAQTGTGGSAISLIFNGDQTSSYAFHGLQGDGASASATGSASVARADIGIVPQNGHASNIMGVLIVDIHDYQSTTKNKTVRAFSGFDANGSGTVMLTSGLFTKTNAVTSVAFSNQNNAQNWLSGSTFALYGIKGA